MILDVCRVCLSSDLPMIHLFESMTEDGITLAEMYAITSGLPLAPNDQWPQWICTTCLTTMIQSYEMLVLYEANMASYNFN